MSVLNIHFAADRVDLLSDTLVYADGKPAGLCDRKVHVAPHGMFAWSTRGRCRLGDMLDPIAARCSTTDEAEVAALAWIEAVSDDDLAGSKGIEATVAGWSDRAGDLVVIQFEREAGKPVTAKSYARGVHLLPASRRMPALPPSVTEAQFVRLALAQHRVSDLLEAGGADGLCIGGCGHITTITRAGAIQRLAFLYPDHAEHAAMFGDPNAAEVAAFLADGEAVAA